MTTTIRGTDNSAAAPALTGNDLDTGVYFPAANKLGLVTGGTERVIVDDSGNVGVGTSSIIPVYITSASEVSPKFQIYGTSAATSTLSLVRSDNTPYFSFSNGSSGNNVVNNSTLGRIVANGYDGTSYRVGGEIAFEVDGTPGTADMPGRLVFSTTADGAAGPTARMRITSDGYVRLTSSALGIQFNGDTAAANALDDYEEGTFNVVYTPASGSFTMSGIDDGKYTKIGNVVNFVIRIGTSGLNTASGAVTITGLPFTSAADPNRCACAVGEAWRWGASLGETLWVQVAPSASYLTIYTNVTDATTTTSLDASNFASGTNYNILSISGSYLAA